jgi:zinc ribbon protein
VEQTSATTPASAAPGTINVSAQTDAAGAEAQPGFAARGRLRRRARFLRKARELAYRDLGGLVFNLHRFGQRNDALVLAKLSTLGQIDTELRSLETALEERQPVTVLREAGITACPRCAAIHASEDRFCPNCGLPMSRNVDLPIAGPASGPAPTAPAGAAAPPTPVSPPTAVHASEPPRSWSAAAPAPPTTRAQPGAPRAPTPPVRAGAGGQAAVPAPSGAPIPDPAAPVAPAAGSPAQPAAGAEGPSTPPAATSAADEEPTEIVRPSSGNG